MLHPLCNTLYIIANNEVKIRVPIPFEMNAQRPRNLFLRTAADSPRVLTAGRTSQKKCRSAFAIFLKKLIFQDATLCPSS